MRRRRRHEKDRLREVLSEPLTVQFSRLPKPIAVVRPSDLRPVEDRRSYYPARFRPARLIDGSSNYRLVVAKPATKPAARTKSRLPSAVGFQDPRKVVICVRRKIRKEVLHALRKTGRGGSRSWKRKRNVYSDVRC